MIKMVFFSVCISLCAVGYNQYPEKSVLKKQMAALKAENQQASSWCLFEAVYIDYAIHGQNTSCRHSNKVIENLAIDEFNSGLRIK